MPKIKIEKVISFSSEDSIHLANNILSNDPSKKWKCHTVGEKFASLILQLEEASIISSIDIGNEHSAYVEVLVSRSCSSDDFKLLLVMSSFMTPLEARQSTNVNKVRMFSYEQLIKPERDEKWDRVKIICTQPFNRHVQYGLSFITFHTIGKNEETQVLPHIGKFALRPESPSEITVRSLFARKRELYENKPLTAAAAIRDASLSPEQFSANSNKLKLPQAQTSINEDVTISNASRKRDEIFYSKDEEKPNKKIDTIIEQKKLEKDALSENFEVKKIEKGKRIKIEESDKERKILINKENIKLNDDQSTGHAGPSSSKGRAEPSKRKLKLSENTLNKKSKRQLSKLFHQLLGDVVVVISGIQNPDRANIRTMALEMGARYKADWDNSCTHLVCAFPNTPKFNQVKGKGKIVTMKWITDCHLKRKRLPWRRYAFDKNDKTKDESEEEICEEKETITEKSDDENRDVKSGSDTEDEIERINTLHQQSNIDNSHTENETEKIRALNTKKEQVEERNGVYDCTTDEETYNADLKDELPPLPNCFKNEIFYIDDNLSENEKKTLKKYITACNGNPTTSVSDSVDFVITLKEYKMKLPAVSSKTTIINPDFIYECFNSKKLLAADNYKI